MLLIKGLTIKARSPCCWVSSTLTPLLRKVLWDPEPSDAPFSKEWEIYLGVHIELCGNVVAIVCRLCFAGSAPSSKTSPHSQVFYTPEYFLSLCYFSSIKKKKMSKWVIFWHQDHYRPKQVVLRYCHRNRSKRNKHKACLQLFSFRLPVHSRHFPLKWKRSGTALNANFI